MNRHVIAVLAAMVFSIPAMAQQPARKFGEQDQRCQFDRDRDRHRDRSGERRADRVATSGESKPCAPNPHATRAGDPNPYATRAGDPNSYATRAGDPNPYATRAGAPKR